FQSLFNVTAIISLAAAFIIFVTDIQTPLGVAVSALYVIPIIVSVLADHRPLTYAVAGVCTILVIAGYYFSPDIGVNRLTVIADRAIVISLLWITAMLCVSMTKTRQQIRDLGRLLTICAWTKQIKVDDTWISIEDYLTQHLDLKLTHGISKEAAEKYLKDMNLDIR
ncbi:MAG: hypothetical protein ACREEM_14525, partial [Blastocatellia bacterium]